MKIVRDTWTLRIWHQDELFFNVIAFYTKRWSIGIVKWTVRSEQRYWQW